MQTTSPAPVGPDRAAVGVAALHLEHARAEFEEMPGLCLTLAQAARFWGLDQVVCRGVLEHLAGEGFLERRVHGYRRHR